MYNSNVRAIDKLNATELASGLAGTSASWHAQYRDSAFIYTGGLPLTLTEGDLLCIFSQYGEILHVHLARDRESGKSKGFAWIKYADQRSTDMAVDNLNGIKVLERVIRVDHAAQFKRPEIKDDDEGAHEARRRRELEDLVGGNVAPEIWNKSLAEMEAVVARRFGGGGQAQDDSGKGKKKKKKDKKRRGDDSNGEESDVSDTGLDPDDPMYKYLKEAKRELKREKRAKRKAKKEAKAAAKSSEPSRTSTRHRSRSRSPSPRADRRREYGRERDEYRSSARDDDDRRSDREHRRSERDSRDRYDRRWDRDHGRERERERGLDY